MKKHLFLLLVLVLIAGKAKAQCATNLVSGVGTDYQIICLGVPITNIVYNTTSITGITNFTGLPVGVTVSFTDPNITISGVPSEIGMFNYNITLTGPGGCSVSGTIIINPVPTPTISGLSTVCENSTGIVYITESAMSGYSWIISGGGVITAGGLSTDNFAEVTWVSTGIQSISVNYINGSGCSAVSPTSYPVTVNALPIPTITSSDADNIICEGSSVTFTAGGGINYNFRINGISVQNSALSTYTTTTLTNSQFVDVIVTSAGSCEATSTGIMNTVNPSPTITTTGTLNPVCFNPISQIALLNYFATTDNPDKYSIDWDGAANAAGLADQGNTANAFSAGGGIINTITITGGTPAGTYFGMMRIENSGGCSGYQSITLTINPAAVISGMSATTCSGVPFTVTPVDGTNGVVPLGTTYIWPAPAVTGGMTGGAASGGNQPNIQGNLINMTNTSQTATYIVTPISGSCTGSDFSVTITVNPQPTLATLLNTVCSDQNTGITLSVAGGSVAASTYNISAINMNGLTASAGFPSTGTGLLSNVIIDDAFTNKTSANVNVIYIVTPVSGSGCLGNSSIVDLTVKPEPVLAVLNTTKCSDDALGFNLSVAGGSTPASMYDIISIIPNGLIASSGSPGPGAGLAANVISDDAWTNKTSAPVNVVYTIIPVGANGCYGDAYTVTIQVNPEPQLATLDATKCSNSSLGFSLSVAGGSIAASTYNIVAINNGGLTASAGSPVTGSGFASNVISDDAWTNTTNSAVNVIYSIIPVSASGCQGDLKTITITVNPEAQVNDPPDQVICNGAMTSLVNFSTLNSGGTATYSWTNSNATINLAASGTGNISAFTAMNSGTAPVTATITVTPHYTNNTVTCDGPAQTFTITVNPTGQVNASADQVVCHSGSTTAVTFGTVNTGGITTYDWVNSNPSIGLPLSGSGNISSYMATNTGTSSVVATITVTPHYDNNSVICDGPSKTFTITVNPNSQVNDPADQVVCNGAITSFINFSTINTGGTTTYNWINDNTAIGLSASGSGDIASFTGINAGTIPVVATITVTPTFTNGGTSCNGPSQYFSITVNPSPSTSAITGNQTPACNETNIVYSVTLTAGSNYTWDVPTGAVITSGATGPDNNTITVNFSTYNGNISVIETLPSSCSGNQVTLPISLQGCGFMADFDANSRTICNGTSVIFTNLSTGTTGSTTYSWDFGANASPATITGPGPHVVTYNGSGTSTVSLTINDVSTDTKTMPGYITVNPLPITSPINGEALICQNAANKIYQVVQNAGSQYLWNVPAIITKTFDAGLYFIHADANSSGTGEIMVTETNTSTGCTGLPVILNITVSPTITGSLPTGPVTVCKDAAGVIFSIPQNAGSIYSWSLPPGAFITGDPTLNQVSVTFPMAGTGNVSVVETNGACTTYHLSKPVTINPLPLPSITAPPIPPRITSTNNVYSTESGMSLYLWNVSPGGSVISGGLTSDNFVNITWNSTGNQTVSVNYTNPVTSCIAATPTVFNSTIFPLPTANNVSISGSITIGNVLTGSYSYVDGGGGSEGTSTYRWLRNGSELVGIALTYTTIAADLNKTITFEVTPVSNTGNPNAGIAVKSSPSPAIEDPSEIPVVSEVCIEGVRGTGNTIRGKYKFTHSRPEGISLYQWYNGSTPIAGANSIQYVLLATDISNNSDIVFEVTPVSSNTVPNSGTPVKSNSFAKFTLPQSEYSDAISSVALTASPAGGIFSGPYITNGIFSPKQAGAGGPYPLQYILNIVNSSVSCSQQAIKEITVVPNTTTFSGFDAAYCKDGSNDIITITDYPPASTSLGFSATVPDAIVSQTAWTVTINPGKMKAGINKDILTFRYNFGGYDYTITHPFVIDSVGTNIQFVNLNSEYCDNSAKQTITLNGVYPSGGTGAWTGTVLSDIIDLTSTIEASLGTAGQTYPVTYQYTSPLGCKSQILTRNVTIKPSPEVQSISKDGPLELCLGDFVTLSVANTSGYHYQWKREGIPVGSDLNEFTATDAGTYSLIVSNVSGCFANSSNVINVSNVNSQLISTFKVNGPTSFCQGGNVELSVTNNPLFTYQWQKDGTDIAEATTNAYTAQYSGTYALYVRNSDGCRNKTEDVNVIVSNLPVAPLITSGGPLVFCQDDSVILSVTNTPGYIYHWKHNDNSTGSNLNSYAAKSAGTYSLVVSNAAGCTVNSLNSLNVSVNTKPGVPAVNISGPTSFCQGGNVLLSVVNNADCKYQWQKDGSDIPDATTNSYSAKNEGDYSLNVINLSGCTSKTDKVNLNVFAVPDAQTISSAGPLELCLGDSTILSVTGTAGYTYQWKRNGQHIGSNLNSFAAKTSGTYSLVISNSSGCSVNTANTIDISDANSQLTTTFKVSGSTSFCQGNSVEMSVSANPEYKYQWQKDGANINGATDHLYSASDSGIYCLNVINSKGCKNKTEDVKVIVFNSPAAPLILTEGSVQLCQGDSVILSVTNTPGYSYQWKLNSGAVGSDSINYIAKVSGTYTLTVSNSIECSASSINSVPVTVNPLPVIGTISQIGNDTKFCRGENITLSVPQNGTYKYSWMNRSVYIPDAALNTFTAGESGEYTVEVTSDAGCRIIPEPVKIEVVEMPSMPAIDKGTYFPKMCLGENLLKFSVKDSVSGYNYKWYRNGTPYSSAKSILIQDEGRYYLEAKIDICTSPYDSLIVDFQDDILPKPDIYARGSTIWYLTTSADAKYYSWSFNGKIIPGADKKYYVANQDLGVYRVGVSKDKECFTFSDTLRIIAGTTGIEDEDIFKDIKIYPNPTTGLITIVMENNTCGELNIDVMKQNGSIIMNHKFEKNSGFFSGVLDLSGSSSGIYLLRISIQNNITTRKIILK